MEPSACCFCCRYVMAASIFTVSGELPQELQPPPPPDAGGVGGVGAVAKKLTTALRVAPGASAKRDAVPSSAIHATVPEVVSNGTPSIHTVLVTPVREEKALPAASQVSTEISTALPAVAALGAAVIRSGIVGQAAYVNRSSS